MKIYKYTNLLSIRHEFIRLKWLITKRELYIRWYVLVKYYLGTSDVKWCSMNRYLCI